MSSLARPAPLGSSEHDASRGLSELHRVHAAQLARPALAQAGLDKWGNDPSLKAIPTSNDEVCSWLLRAQRSGSDPYQYLFEARNVHRLDRHDFNLVAAERYMGGYTGEFSDTLILGQHILKQIRDVPGMTAFLGRNGSPSSSSAFVAKWGMLGNLHREQGASVGGLSCGNAK